MKYSVIEMAEITRINPQTIRSRIKYLKDRGQIDSYRKYTGNKFLYSKEFLNLLKGKSNYSAITESETDTYTVNVELPAELLRGFDKTFISDEVLPLLVSKHLKITKKMIIECLK